MNPTNKLAAYAWVTAATFLFAVMFMLPKLVGAQASPLQVAGLRYVSGFLAILPFLLIARTKRGELHVGSTAKRGRLRTYRFHLLRALFGSVTVVLGAYAVTQIPLANAQAISMTNGVFAVVFAILFLKERIGPRGVAAIALGIAGAFVVADPRFDDSGQWLSIGVLAALFGALTWGADTVTLKFTATRDDPVRLLCIVNGAAALLMIGPALLSWRPLEMPQLATLLSMGPIAILGQFCNIRGFRMATAVDLTAVRYSSIVFAALFGIAFFDEWPSRTALVGSLMICGSAFVILRFGTRSNQD